MLNKAFLWALLLVISLFMLVTGCSPRGNTSPAAQASPTPLKMTAQELAAIQGEGWNRTEYVDPMDGHKTVSFSIFSKNQVLFRSKEDKVLLSLTCDDYGSFTVDSGPVDNRNVRIKFDEAPPISQKWFAGPSWLSTRAAPLFKPLVNAKVFKFEFSPMGRGPQVATFNVANLKDLATHESACKL